MKAVRNMQLQVNSFSFREKHLKQHLLTTNTFAATNHHTCLLNNVFSLKTGFIRSCNYYS